MEQFVTSRDGTKIYARVDGTKDKGAPTVVFANSLGSTIELWEPVLPLLPPNLRFVRFDNRGHGRSDVPDGPYTMGAMVSDAEAVCTAFDVKDCIFVGMSVGGLIAQGLAVKRLDLVRGLVLSNTAAKIGNAKMWQDRIDLVRENGMALAAEQILPRWFSRDFMMTPELSRWRDMLKSISVEGYCGVCSAIAGTDFYTPTSGLRLPTLGIAGSEDRSTPPDLVRETIDLIPGSEFKLIRKSGHLPCVDQPDAFAEALVRFLAQTGHTAPSD